jgi:cytochrome c biogenesis factor
MSIKIGLAKSKLPDVVLSAIPAEEAAGASDVLARDGNTAIVGMQGDSPLFYAVLGVDEIGAVSAYYVRTFVPVMGPMLAKQFFGAAQVSGRPIRVHSDTMKRAMAMARAAGADLAGMATDGDGVPLGIFV